MPIESRALAVARRGDETIVHMTPLETGDSYGDNTAILSGLEPGARVVVDYLQSMRENLEMNPRMDGEGEARH